MTERDTKGCDYVRQRMPRIGLGTYLIKDEEELRNAIDAALKAGYRFVDTAQVYRNEAIIGRALADLLPNYKLTRFGSWWLDFIDEFRDQIFITSKLDPRYNSAKAYDQICKSVYALNSSYIDLFLIHWPGKSGLRVQDKRNREARQLAWKGLERAYGKFVEFNDYKNLEEGLVRAIGVSNYQPRHLDELMEYARVQPALNQCEYHPAYCPSNVIDACRRHEIIFQAYSSFGGSNNFSFLENELFIQLADKYKCTVAQLLLAWSLQQGYSVLPKSVNPDHIRANFDASEVKLSTEDIEKMRRLTQKKFCWNPETVA